MDGDANCSTMLLPADTICMEHPEEMLKPWKTNPMFSEIVAAHAATFVFGLLGNVVVIAVLAGNGKAKTATNSFLVSLALGDLLMLCVYGPLETYTYFVINWDEDGVVCKMAKFAEFVSATSSVLNLMAVTLERFLVIVFPLKSRTVCTIGNTVKAIAGVWLLAIVLASPVVPMTGTYTIRFTNNVTNLSLNYCNQSADSPAFAIYQFFVIFFVPGGIMIVCYALVIRELWTSTREIRILTNDVKCGAGNSSKAKPYAYRCRKANRGEVNAARKQVIKMLIMVVVLFYVGWGPRATMDVFQKFHMVPFTQGFYRTRILFNILTFMHGCVNPVVYSLMSKNFRKSLRKLASRCCGKEEEGSGRRPPPPRTPKRTGDAQGRAGRPVAQCSFASTAETKSTAAEAATTTGENPSSAQNASGDEEDPC